MLKQGAVRQLQRHELPRTTAHLVVTMAYYPRGIRREWHHDYRHFLGPTRELFKKWKCFEKTVGHEEAFRCAKYEERFEDGTVTDCRMRERIGEARQDKSANQRGADHDRNSGAVEYGSDTDERPGQAATTREDGTTIGD